MDVVLLETLGCGVTTSQNSVNIVFSATGGCVQEDINRRRKVFEPWLACTSHWLRFAAAFMREFLAGASEGW
jgi:hypothetical protein